MVQLLLSVAEGAALHVFLASCSRSLHPVLLLPPATTVGVVLKCSKRIVAKLALAGPSVTTSRAQRNLKRTLPPVQAGV
uniref:Uncharacterized protein n=1 Tax=Oryza barthii TaxID=65489 RepID=A0A0D3G732_9ORYZ